MPVLWENHARQAIADFITSSLPEALLLRYIPVDVHGYWQGSPNNARAVKI